MNIENEIIQLKVEVTYHSISNLLSYDRYLGTHDKKASWCPGIYVMHNVCTWRGGGGFWGGEGPTATLESRIFFTLSSTCHKSLSNYMYLPDSYMHISE